MKISAWLLRIAGWKVEVKAPDYDKCIICVAPHTSNWDFILGLLAYWSVGRKAGFLMKEAWFFFPMGCLLRALGGIPVKRGNRNDPSRISMVDAIVEKFHDSAHMQIAITPEGTRSRTAKWHTGFLQISYKAQVPVVLGAIDFKKKEIIVDKVLDTTGDIDTDMRRVKDYYRHFTAKYPDKFTTDS